MSDSLLPRIHAAFEHQDWATVIQCLRQFSPQPVSSLTEMSEGESSASPVSVSIASAPASNPDAENQEILQFAVKTLTCVDFQARWELVSLITKFDADAIPALTSILETFDPDDDDEEEDWDLLWFIARILGQIRHPSAIAALIQVLQTSPREDVVTAAIMALAQQGIGAIAPLTQLLNHDATKVLAAQALAQIFAQNPAPQLRDILITITQDPNPTLRALVTESLSHSHHPQVTDILITALDDVAAIVRRAAVTGLGIQSKTLDTPLLLSSLEPRLWDLDTEVRRQASIALGRVQTSASATLLATALNAQDFPSSLKPDVVRALVWTDTQAGLNALAHYLQHHSPKAPVYQEIAVMLGRVESPHLYSQATQLLLELLNTHGITWQSIIIRQSIAMSLGQLQQPEAEMALVKLTQDEDERVKLHAIAALKHLHSAHADLHPEEEDLR